MGQVTDLQTHRSEPYWRTARALKRCVDEQLDVMSGLTALRELGPSAEAAVEAVLTVPEVRRLALSWALLEVMMVREDLDSDALLAQVFDPKLLALAHAALFGTNA